MRLKRWVRLPWILKDALRSMRRDVADSRRMISELAQAASDNQRMISELAQAASDNQRIISELAQAASDNQRMISELTEATCDNRQTLSDMLSHAEQRHGSLKEEMYAMREMLQGEIREQGVLIETAVRFPARAVAERNLRAQLTPPLARKAGLSVLITCWNHAGFLGRSVASAIATLDSLPTPGEVLVLDDGSRDGSREVARELARGDDRIRLIQSDENLGLPLARNLLLWQARYDHSMILDSDNQLVPSGVATLFAAARQTGAVLAYGNILKVDPHGSVVGVMSNERVTPNLRQGNTIDAMALVRTDRILELGGYEIEWLYGVEDWELNLRLFSRGEPMVFVPVLVGKYWMLPSSMINEAPAYLRVRRGHRIFSSLEATDAGRYRASVHHPAIGTIWSSSNDHSDSTSPSQPASSRRSTPSLKILVVTSGGVRNYGDDAILLSTLQRLRRIRPDSVALVISDGTHCPALGRLGAWAGTCDEFVSGLDPEVIQRGCRNDRVVAEELSTRRGACSYPRAEMQSFDLVIIAGGGNLNSYWPDLIARRTAIAAAANSARVPYILSGQGVGPVSAEILPMLSFLVGGASAVATRDTLSLDILKQLAPNGPRINMVGDDALGMHYEETVLARKRLAEIGVPLDRPFLCFHARQANYVDVSREDLQNTARQVDEFAAENGYVVLAVPINMQHDGHEAGLLGALAYGSRRLAPWHIVNHADNVAAIAGTIKLCSAVLTHSYHEALFALESRIPTLLFANTEYYRLKAEALRTAFGIPVPLLAQPGIDKTVIKDMLDKIAHSSWSRGMTNADVDGWLYGALPRFGGPIAKPSTADAGFQLHTAMTSLPSPNFASNPSPGVPARR